MAKKISSGAVSEALETVKNVVTPDEHAARLFERVSNLDFRKTDALVAAGIVGGAFAAIMAVRAARNSGEDPNTTVIEDKDGVIKVSDRPAHHMPDSLSLFSRGSAVSLPRDEEAAERMRGSKGDVGIVMVDPHGKIEYPLRQDGNGETPRYRQAVEWAGGIASQALAILMSNRPPQQPQG